ncbi:MAG: sulfite exporter TauE/SafE family protein [Myxococcales bacterium]|nr:sulfite exporter TauE/SafE family protein [Myxococcales bacterium]MCB9702304.1 sulfite exporter TauE/SafE family protein [Myxococcales bacterium]
MLGLAGLDLAASPLVGLALLAAAGLFAGIVNTLAGGGSFLILPLLIGLGLPPTVANGTSRVGVVVQGLSSAWTFHGRGIREYRITARLAAPMVVGALVGAWLATRFDDELLRPLIGVILVAWALILGLRPGRFLKPPPEPSPPSWLSDLASVAIGLYGGFLQAGVGFPLLALLVPGLGYPAVAANAIKVRVVLIYSLLSLPIFALAGQIAWREGLVLGAGTMAGGWLGAHIQLRAGAGVVRWAVLVMVAIGGIMLLR